MASTRHPPVMHVDWNQTTWEHSTLIDSKHPTLALVGSQQADIAVGEAS